MPKWNKGMRSDDLNIGALRVLTVVNDLGSLTRAAKALDTTQPQLSKTLAKLREFFDDRLFVRAGHTLRPTARATQILTSAQAVLDAASELEIQPSFDPSTSERVFSLSVSDTGAARLAPDLLLRMRTDAPHVRLTFHQPDSSDLLKMLESGEVDLAIGPFPGLVPGIRRRRLLPATYKVLAVPDHPFIRDQSIQRYRESDHVLVTLGDRWHAHSAVVRRIEQGVPPERIVLRVAGFVTAGFVAKRARVLATVPTFQAVVMAEELGLEVANCPLRLQAVEIAQFWHERFDREAGHIWLRRLVYEVMRKGAQRKHGEPG
jgi:DNA-binding transcriptional LysR family regulator